MHRLFVFNPGNEAALAHIDKTSYTPTARVQRLSIDLYSLCRFLGDSSDIVWCPYAPEEAPIACSPTGSTIRHLMADDIANTSFILTPWGAAPPAYSSWIKAANTTELPELIRPPEIAELRRLTDRSMSVDLLKALDAAGYRTPPMLSPEWITTEEELHTYLERRAGVAILAKLPYSSSGRGLIPLSTTPTYEEINNVRRALKKNGRLSLEPRLKRESDWAMEWYSDGIGQVHFLGYSHFETSRLGHYEGNRLATEERLRADFAERIGDGNKQRQLEVAMQLALSQLYGHFYQGPLGVDMLFYESEEEQEVHRLALHPAIEINCRYTMGHLSIELMRRLVNPSTRATYHIHTAGSSESLQAFADEIARLHPTAYDSQGLLTRGFLQLTPIKKDTQFLAYILSPTAS